VKTAGRCFSCLWTGRPIGSGRIFGNFEELLFSNLLLEPDALSGNLFTKVTLVLKTIARATCGRPGDEE